MICLTASRRTLRASQMATNCTSFSRSIHFRSNSPRLPIPIAAHHDALAGGSGSVTPEGPCGDDRRSEANRAGGGRTFQALAAGELLPTRSGSRHGVVSVVLGSKTQIVTGLLVARG